MTIFRFKTLYKPSYVESVAQVVGRRTQDHKVMSLSPNSGLISKVVAKL